MVHKTPIGGKLQGFYIGEVIRHLSHGCLKVFIPSVHKQEWREHPEYLPICYQVSSLFGGSFDGNGVFSYPNIGAKVMCGFANEDQNYIYCFGVLMGGQDATHQYNIASNIDDTRTITDTLSDNIVRDKTYQTVYDISSTVAEHRITCGKTHVTFFESGILSARIDTPLDTHVSALQPLEVDTQFVMDQIGCISASTNDIPNQIFSQAIMDINGQIYLESRNAKNNTYSKIKLDSAGNITVQSTNQLDILIKEDSGSDTSHMNMNSKGSIQLDSTKDLTIKTPTINIETTTLNEKASTINIETTTLNEKASTINIETATLNEKASTINIETTALNEKASTNNIEATTNHIGNVTVTGKETVTVDSDIGGKSFIDHIHIGNMGAPTSPPN